MNNKLNKLIDPPTAHATIVDEHGNWGQIIVVPADGSYLPNGYTIVDTSIPLDPATARIKRDALLVASDPWAAPDRITVAWTEYRQALRDVPAQAGFPTNITWPTKPS